MSKRKIIGLSMILIGTLYFILLFNYIDIFEKMNDTLGMILTMVNAILIIWGIIISIFKTPKEHFKEEAIKHQENIKLSKYYKYKPYITYVLIGINVIVFLIINIMQDEEIVLDYAISKNDFAFYRIITAMFTHINEMHLIFNMFALYICGSKLEALIGNMKYLYIYLLTGIGTSILIALLSNYPCVGASGAIFGLFSYYLLLAFKNRHIMKYTYKYDLLPTVITNLIITFIIPNISVVAHVGGLIIGIMCYFILGKNAKIV